MDKVFQNCEPKNKPKDKGVKFQTSPHTHIANKPMTEVSQSSEDTNIKSYRDALLNKVP